MGCLADLESLKGSEDSDKMPITSKCHKTPEISNLPPVDILLWGQSKTEGQCP